MLPPWLAELGFELREMRPLTETPRPHEYGWRWPHAFVDVGLQRLVDLGRVTRERADVVTRAFRESQAVPGAFSLNPTVLEIIAVKR
jgi:hypothetical protein